MLNTFWNLSQQQQIAGVASDTFRANQFAKDTSARVTELEHAVDRLTLINRALWEIIQEYHPVDNDSLIAKITEIDLRDGHLDGKLTRHSVLTCEQCGNKLSAKHIKCIYCGHAVTPGGDPFDGVR